MSEFYVGSLNLTRLDQLKSKAKKSEKTGDLYLSVAFWVNDEADQFGNNGSVSFKEQGSNDKVYVGNFKKFEKTPF